MFLQKFKDSDWQDEEPDQSKCEVGSSSIHVSKLGWNMPFSISSKVFYKSRSLENLMPNEQWENKFT